MIKKSFILFVILSLGSISSVFSQARLSKNPDAMLWTIEGTDNNGKESKVYILGTIHVGDERLYPLPYCVIEAWADSNTFVSEVSSESWGKLQSKVNAKVIKSAANAKKLRRSLLDDLTDEEMDLLETIDGFIDQLYIFEPWVIQQIVDESLISKSSLSPDKGYDSYLTKIATNAGINLEGLDELKVQLDLLSYGDWDHQLKMLRESLEQYKNPKEANKELYSLYEAYLTHDVDSMKKAFITDGIEKAVKENPDLENYYKAMLDDRNEVWSEKINDYLKKGGTTFIFAGAGHFISEKSVFNIMRKKGYLF